jgi:hypothetical protein
MPLRASRCVFRSASLLLTLWASAAFSQGRPSSPTPSSSGLDPTKGSEAARALALLEEARRSYAQVRDYQCVFIKRERIEGELRPHEFVLMKVRTHPFSVYMRWLRPYEGREVLYVPHLYGNQLIAHEAGVKGVVTVELDPHGERALREARYPITEAGLGKMIEKLQNRWTQAAKDSRFRFEVKAKARVGNRGCWCVKTSAPMDRTRYDYYRTRVFFDEELKLPIRFEGYVWPTPAEPDGVLVEEYTYDRLQLNVGLTDLDFRQDNPAYGF